MIYITAEMAIEALRKLVKEKGSNFIYRPPVEFGGCRYQYEMEPSCGVGWVLNRKFGVPLSTLAMVEGSRAHTLDIRLTQAGSHVRITSQAADVLQVFQGLQDSSCPYDMALSRAEYAYRGLPS
jgi:hypothetical protein